MKALRYRKWLEGLSFVTYPHLYPVEKSLIPGADWTMDYGPFPGDLSSLLSGKGGALAASLCSSEALCPLWVTSRLPQCSHQALGTHAPKGIQFGSTKQW